MKTMMNEVVLSKKQLDYISKQVALYITGTMSGYMTTEQKAKQLGISERTLRRKAREGKIDAEKRGDTNQSRLMFSIEAKIM